MPEDPAPPDDPLFPAPDPMPMLPGPLRSMLPVPVPPAAPSSRRHRSFSTSERALQRLPAARLVPVAALPAPMPEPEVGAAPVSGVAPLTPGVLLPVVLSAEPLLAPALEFEASPAPVLPDIPLEVWASGAADSPSIATAAAAAPSDFLFMSSLLEKSGD
jgi:hypothetical protein